MKHFSNRKSGFTLLELQVVVAINVIGASMLIPTLTAANDLAKRAQCASNVNAIGLAVTQYHFEHNGWLPMTMASGGYTPTHPMYYTEFGPYLGYEYNPCWRIGSLNPGLAQVLACPAETLDYGGKHIGYGWNWVYLGAYPKYGYPSGAQGHWWSRRKITEVARPNETSCLGGTRPIPGCWMPPLGSVFWWGSQESVTGEWRFGRRHDDGANYLCVDGHVEYATFDDLVDDFKSDEQRIFWPWELP